MTTSERTMRPVHHQRRATSTSRRTISAHLPAAIRLTARRPVRLFLLAPDGHGLLILAAVGPTGLVRSDGCHGAGMTAVGVVPRHALARRGRFQRTVLALRRHALVSLVEHVAHKPTDQGASDHARGDGCTPASCGARDEATESCPAQPSDRRLGANVASGAAGDQEEKNGKCDALEHRRARWTRLRMGFDRLCHGVMRAARKDRILNDVFIARSYIAEPGEMSN